MWSRSAPSAAPPRPPERRGHFARFVASVAMVPSWVAYGIRTRTGNWTLTRPLFATKHSSTPGRTSSSPAPCRSSARQCAATSRCWSRSARRSTALLKRGWGAPPQTVIFAPMQELGRNPARIIPAWRDFVGAWADGRPVRGIGEPIWPERSAGRAGRVPSPRVAAEPRIRRRAAVVAALPLRRRSPRPRGGGGRAPHPPDGARETVSASPATPTRSRAPRPGPFEGPLAPPPGEREELTFSGAAELADVRAFVAEHAAAAGLGEERVADFVLAVHELANNSVRHVGGEALLRVWTEPEALVAEVRDGGRIEGPLSGRERPRPSRFAAAASGSSTSSATWSRSGSCRTATWSGCG